MADFYVKMKVRRKFEPSAPRSTCWQTMEFINWFYWPYQFHYFYAGYPEKPYKGSRLVLFSLTDSCPIFCLILFLLNFLSDFLPRKSSKILPCASYVQLSSTASNAWYITWNQTRNQTWYGTRNRTKKNRKRNRTTKNPAKNLTRYRTTKIGRKNRSKNRTKNQTRNRTRNWTKKIEQ